MSTYTAVETALHTLVLAYSPNTLDARAVARGSWGVLGAPGDWACVLTIGAPTAKGDALEGRGAHGQRQERHTTHVEVYRKVKQAADGDSAAYTALVAFVDALDTYLARYPRLNNTAAVQRAEVTLITDVENVGPPPPAAPTHLRQTLVVTTLCSVPRDYSVEVAQ